MRPVLFRLPLPTPWSDHVAVSGYGSMLALALVVGVWLAGRRARREGIAAERARSAGIWVIAAGVVGARLVFLLQYGQPLSHFFHVWDGGLVWYGGLAGGLVACVLVSAFVLRREGVPGWKLADVFAPAAALGLAITRVGCLLAGCCYGGVACPHCPSLHFPVHGFAGGLRSPGPKGLVPEGYQAAAGFTVTPASLGEGAPCVVAGVDASSAAAGAGLRPGDQVVKADGNGLRDYGELARYLLSDPRWRQGKTDWQLTVRRGGAEVELPPFRPQTLGLYPTQVYESISMVLLFLLLTAYFPLRRHDGEVLLLFLTLYAVHRFLNEMLRHDTDPVAFGLTLSQNGSLLILAAALALWAWVLSRPPQYHPFRKTAAAAAA